MTVLVAFFVGALTFGAVMVVQTTRRRVALHRQLGHYVGPSTTSSFQPRGFLDGRVAERMEALLARVGLKDRLALALDRAGIESSPGAVASVLSLATGGLFLVVLVWRGAGPALLVAVVAPAAVLLGLAALAARRARAFEAQLPELLDNLAASLKAGHGFDHALHNLSTDIGDPAGREFRRVVAEVHLGRTLESALADLGRRVRSKDLEFVLDAISVQRQVGGSLAELFALVAETVRQREQFRRKLKAITGLPRMSARILTALPILVALLLSAVNHSYMSPLWSSGTGRTMLVVTLAMIAAGSVLLRRIGTVKP